MAAYVAAHLLAERWAPFITNPDQPRAMTLLGGDVAAAKIAATALLTLPGTSVIDTWFVEHIFLLYPVPDYVRQYDATFLPYPPA